ncbi:hypothetical protein R6Q57_025119 [Mikania cordata]
MSIDSSLCSSIGHCSNLESFLHSVTPIIKHASLSLNNEHMIKLQDIWEIYDEWSSCGVGIPVLLESGEMIVQYYVPCLSAIQIFIKNYTSNSSNDYHNYDHHLYVQYYESCSPYLRLPFLDKIIELSQQYPGLLTFYINDISPASWMSVAWYPTCHIPSTVYRTKDLSTCFLTFHALSYSYQDYINEEGVEGGCMLDLAPFGLATYKMQGDVWNNEEGDDEKIKDLETAAGSWLKQLHVQHHDFIFFTQ